MLRANKRRGKLVRNIRLVRPVRLSHKNDPFLMVVLRQKYSGLPVNLYLDDTGSWIKGEHGPIIKFQGNHNSSTDTNKMVPMTISDDPFIISRIITRFKI